MDNLIEDEAERERLLAKPTCFIIVGRPVICVSFIHTARLIVPCFPHLDFTWAAQVYLATNFFNGRENDAISDQVTREGFPCPLTCL